MVIFYETRQEMQKLSYRRTFRRSFCRRHTCNYSFAARLSCSNFGNVPSFAWNYLLQKMKRGIFMKVVVVKNPKIVSGLLRMIFGIKKVNHNT